MRIAVFTFQPLREDQAHPDMQPFTSRIHPVFYQADKSDGFVAHYKMRDPAGGTIAYPRFVPKDVPHPAQTLTLWEDLESVYAFAYRFQHVDAMRNTLKTLADERPWPNFVAWWVEDDHVPQRAGGVERFELLYDQGPSPRAFDFQHPFDSDGKPATIDRKKVDTKIAINERNHVGAHDLR